MTNTLCGRLPRIGPAGSSGQQAQNCHSCGQPHARCSLVSCVPGLQDTGGVNRERAETFLRLVAEAELRQARTPARDGAAARPEVAGAGRGTVVARPSAVAAALYDLPVRQREVIALQYYGNLSEAETAAALHITRGAVHAHAAHGMSALRDALRAGTSCRVAQVARVLTA